MKKIKNQLLKIIKFFSFLSFFNKKDSDLSSKRFGYNSKHKQNFNNEINKENETSKDLEELDELDEMLEFSKILKEEERIKVIKERDCKTCENNKFCKVKGKIENASYCEFLNDIKFNPKKESIIIIDDNDLITKIISEFLKTDFSDEYNILSFSGKFCGFEAISFLKNNPGIKIKLLIVDLYFPAVVIIENSKFNLKIDGIDVINQVKNKDFKLGIITNLTDLQKFNLIFSKRIDKDDFFNFLIQKNKIIQIFRNQNGKDNLFDAFKTFKSKKEIK